MPTKLNKDKLIEIQLAWLDSNKQKLEDLGVDPMCFMAVGIVFMNGIADKAKRMNPQSDLYARIDEYFDPQDGYDALVQSKDDQYLALIFDFATIYHISNKAKAFDRGELRRKIHTTNIMIDDILANHLVRHADAITVNN
jgi:hypothetical protein